MNSKRFRRTGRRGSVLLGAVLALLFSGVVEAQTESDASSGGGPCREGMRLAAERRYEEAREVLVACLEDEGEALEPLIALTAMALDQDRHAEALDWSSRAADGFPDSADAHYWRGRALTVTGSLEGARSCWEQGLQLNQNHAPTLRALANLLLSLGEERPAYGLLNHLIMVDGPDPWSLKTLSNLARKNGLWRQALAHWDAALRVSAPDAGDLRMAGELAILAGDTAYAMRSASDAVDLEPSPSSWGVLGEALFAARRFEEAIPVFEQVLVMDPSAASVHFHLANAYELVGRVEDAELEFRRYTAQRSDDPTGFFNFAVHLDKRGLTSEALRQIEQALMLAPDQETPSLFRAGLLEKLGDDAALILALDDLLARGVGDAAGLTAWRLSVEERITTGEMHAGQVLLFHIVTPDSTAVRLIEEDLLDGLDFSVIATRYSVGSTAGQGGDIGWVDPDDMAADLRRPIKDLAIQEVSRAIPSEGLYHFFKRVR